MEVKIGVQHSARELVLESKQTPDEVRQAVTVALGETHGLLSLEDDKGRRVMVPADKVSYVEIAEAETRRVGFIA